MAKIQVNSQGKVYVTSNGILGALSDIDTQPLNIIPSTSVQQIEAPTGVNGYNPVNVAAVTSAIDQNIVAGNIKKDVSILGVTGTYEGSGGGGSGTRDVTLTRIFDDNGNEIGTWYMNFVDESNNEYKVVLLDAQYRNDSTQWCSDNTNTVTNMPLYSNSLSSWWYDNAKETATQNTQLILDYCSAGGYTSTACMHCRSQSFTIDGVIYYGQLPNLREVFDMWRHRVQIEQMDTSASSHSSTNFNTARLIWASNQYNFFNGWSLVNFGTTNSYGKKNNAHTCPVLEIPA